MAELVVDCTAGARAHVAIHYDLDLLRLECQGTNGLESMTEGFQLCLEAKWCESTGIYGVSVHIACDPKNFEIFEPDTTGSKLLNS
jgi:hypothetical protein